MRRIFFALIFCFPVFVFGQLPCKDTLREPDKYHTVDYRYYPVCGCDGLTYRNTDAAYWWGGINWWDANGPCEDFDIDLYPNMVSADPSTIPQLRIFLKSPAVATVDIYGSMGNLVFERNFNGDQPFALIGGVDPYYLKEAQTYPLDVYLLMVTVNGHHKTVRFIKVDHGK